MKYNFKSLDTCHVGLFAVLSRAQQMLRVGWSIVIILLTPIYALGE